VFAEFMNEWRIHHIFASAEHPETNGLVEKVNGTLVATLAAFVNFEHNNWDQGRIQEAAFAINLSKQSTTQITLFKLVYSSTVVLLHENSFPWQPSERENHEERKRKVDQLRKLPFV
jgi:dihydroorotase